MMGTAFWVGGECLGQRGPPVRSKAHPWSHHTSHFVEGSTCLSAFFPSSPFKAAECSVLFKIHTFICNYCSLIEYFLGVKNYWKTPGGTKIHWRQSWEGLPVLEKIYRTPELKGLQRHPDFSVHGFLRSLSECVQS